MNKLSADYYLKQMARAKTYPAVIKAYSGLIGFQFNRLSYAFQKYQTHYS